MNQELQGRIVEAVKSAYAKCGKYTGAFEDATVQSLQRSYGSSSVWRDAMEELAPLRHPKQLIRPMALEDLLYHARICCFSRTMTSIGYGAISLLLPATRAVVTLQQLQTTSIGYNGGVLHDSVVSLMPLVEVQAAGSGEVVIRIPFETEG